MAKDPRRLGDPGTAAFHVDKYPFYLLNRLVSRYNVIIESRLREIGLDIPSWRVLMVLGQKAPRSLGELADTAVIPVSTMTRIVQRMAAAELIISTPLERDNRVIEVSLTPLGKETLRRARKITAPIYAKVIEGFSTEQFDFLIGSLNALHDNLEELVPARNGGPKVSPARQRSSRSRASRRRRAGLRH